MYDKKQYNSFTQIKGLLWKDRYDAILSGTFLPPLTAVIDLTDMCNLKCYWCNARSFRSTNMLSVDHVKKIIDDIAEWGVKSVCYAGGGEPTLHKNFTEIIKYTISKGIGVSVSTNMLAITDEQIETITNYASMCGMSIDAGTSITWSKIKGINGFNKVQENILKMGKLAENTKLDLTYKMLIVPENQNEIYCAAKLAKLCKAKNFYIRPITYEENSKFSLDGKVIIEQLEKTLNLNNDNFRVYYNFSRVDKSFKKKLLFEKCMCTPLAVTYCADGYAYLCFDYRQIKNKRLCTHLQVRNFWNSKNHKDMINIINKEECYKCTFAAYNEQIEAYKNDVFYKDFV